MALRSGCCAARFTGVGAPPRTRRRWCQMACRLAKGYVDTLSSLLVAVAARGTVQVGDEVSVVPSDWPGEGPIDLAVHDLPHASSTTEWWYLNGHLLVEGQPLSFFAAFFRQVKGYDPQSKAPLYAHSLTWAIFDPGQPLSHTVSRVDTSAPEEGRKRIKRGLGGKDYKFNRALGEILDRGNVPLPDKMFESRVFVSLDRLE